MATECSATDIEFQDRIIEEAQGPDADGNMIGAVRICEMVMKFNNTSDLNKFISASEGYYE